jgi:hypothetical protein
MIKRAGYASKKPFTPGILSFNRVYSVQRDKPGLVRKPPCFSVVVDFEFGIAGCPAFILPARL